MRRILAGMTLGMVLVGSYGSMGWALTFPQRTTVRSLAGQISGKCQELQQWAQLIDQFEQQGWQVSHQYGQGAIEEMRSFTVDEQAKIQARYETLKAELQKLLAQLP